MRIIFATKKWFVLLTVSAGVLLGVLLLVAFFLGNRLTGAEAGKRVRQCLRTELSQRHQAELGEQNRRLPDRATANRWQEEYQHLDRLQIKEIKVRQPLPDILLHPDRPTHVVRVIFSREGQELPPRYFWLSWLRFDREISPFFWYVSW